MALDGHESDLSTRLGYQYILPKSCRNVEDRKILMDIKNILPLDDQPTTVSCATFLSEPSSMHEHSVTNDQRSGQQSEYDAFKNKLSKEDDKGFLLFIITHGRQLATRMPHLSEIGALKTFKMLWSKMTPEHKSWYYNNENVIQNASIRFRDIPTHTNQHQAVSNPNPDNSCGNFPRVEKHSAIKQKKAKGKIGNTKYGDHLERRPQSYGKVYQIPRPVRSRSFTTTNPQRLSGHHWNYAQGLIDNYTVDSNTDEDIQECRQAVDGIITELGDQHYTGLTSFDQIKLLPNFNTNTIKEEEKFENVNDEMKNNSAENCQHYRDQPTRDETAKTPNYPDTKSQLVNSEDKHSGSNKSQNDAVHNDDAREFVMIPCDVQIARLLGWPVDLLPRVSQGYLDRFKVNFNS